MCTYHFDFSSPSGALTEISTNMCLSVGFNHHESVTIKLVKSQKEINEKLEEAQRKDHEKQQEKKAKRGKSNSKWFLLISDQLIDKSPEEMYDILKEYKFPKQYKNLKKS
jgi:major membrane immunogen (membrane-anchored lipoprotein)